MIALDDVVLRDDLDPRLGERAAEMYNGDNVETAQFERFDGRQDHPYSRQLQVAIT